MPDRLYQLAMSVTAADGTITRWGPDELSSESVPSGLTFSTSIPGGFKDMSCTLLRKLNIDYSDQALFDSVKVYGAGGKTAWEGRMVQFPREHGDAFSVKPGAVGWSSHLKDDPSFREIYVDHDLSRWKGPGTTRKINLVTGGFKLDSIDASAGGDPTSGQPALGTSVQGPWSSTAIGRGEGWYDAGGVPIGSVYYAWKRDGVLSNTDTNWTWLVGSAVDDVNSAGDITASLRAAGPGSGTLTATSANRRFAYVLLTYGALAVSNNATFTIYWTKLAVYGRHGLTRQGVASATSAQGFYASDIVAHVIGQAAPLLTYTTGSDGSIKPTTFVIPQAAYLDPTTADDVIADINKYHLYEWGVYDNREFFWRPPNGPDITNWTVRLDEGAQVSLEGDDANNIFNGVFVTYQDGAGTKHTVGPPGSLAEATDASLVDTNPENPVNAHSIPRRWGLLEIQPVTTQAGAIQVGSVWLAEHNLPARRGQITLTGSVDHPVNGRRPVWEVRAGDTITIADRQGDAPRRVIETSYDHDSRKLTGSMDNTVFKLDAIMERMGIQLVGVI